MEAKPGMIVPDVQLTHYVIYGNVDISLLQNYVRIDDDGQ